MLDKTRAYGLDFLFPAQDQIVGTCLRTAGEFARPEMEIIARLLATGEGSGTYIDVGANIGSIALPVASRLPQHRVVAVEGNRHLAAILSANALGNRLANVEVLHAAAGRAAGLAQFPTPALDQPFNFGALGIGVEATREQPHENVRVCTLDEIAPADTRVVKLDVEGYETEVLAGAQRLFAARRASWIVEHKGDDQAHAIADRFLAAGYSLFWLFAPFLTPTAAKNPNANRQVAGDTNILATPSGDPPVPMARLATADERRPKGLSAYTYLRDYGFPI